MYSNISSEGISTKCRVQLQRAGGAENRSGTPLEYGPGGTAFESGSLWISLADKGAARVPALTEGCGSNQLSPFACEGTGNLGGNT
ncbi:hypothetical protein [Paenibacillus aceti]|uniref:hypothetical protein n=1 Tax=Paenibacillus aceti TaxID=1820010 RepID=UPI001E2F0CE1|nr:hypothetical protein [Paenibacillus aceti]